MDQNRMYQASGVLVRAYFIIFRYAKSGALHFELSHLRRKEHFHVRSLICSFVLLGLLALSETRMSFGSQAKDVFVSEPRPSIAPAPYPQLRKRFERCREYPKQH